MGDWQISKSANFVLLYGQSSLGVRYAASPQPAAKPL